MFKQTSKKILLAALLLSTFAAAGCGTMPFAQPGDYGYGDPYSGDYGGDYGGGDPYGGGGFGGSDPYGGGGFGGSDPYAGGGGFAGTTPGSSLGGSWGTVPMPAPMTGELRVGRLNKDTKGILFWKKLTVSGQVSNPSQGVLSGELQISFMRRGKVVETQVEFVTDLAPGQSQSFTVTSRKAADDVQIGVTSLPGQLPGSNYTSGSNYGGGMGGGFNSGGSSGVGGGGYGGYPY